MRRILSILFAFSILFSSQAEAADRSWCKSLVEQMAQAYNVPVNIAMAVTRMESGFNMRAHGAAGERGAMQVMPRTARNVGVYGNLYGPDGIKAGVLVLKDCLQKQGRYGLVAAVSCYNHGAGYVRSTHYGAVVVAMAFGGFSSSSTNYGGFHLHHYHVHHHRHHHHIHPNKYWPRGIPPYWHV